MTLLQAYLRSPKARHALSKRPGDKGFSLIELVVVVAILAILAAVALPNFLGVSKDGQIAAAKNTLATILKECSVKETRTGTANLGQSGLTGASAPVQAAGANLNGYDLVHLAVGEDSTNAVVGDKIIIAASNNNGLANSCYRVAAIPKTALALPRFAITFDPTTGATSKTCDSPTGTSYIEGCTDAAGATKAAGSGVGQW